MNQKAFSFFMKHLQVDRTANVRQMETVLTVVHVLENYVAVAAVIVERWKNPGKYAWSACQKNEPSALLEFLFVKDNPMSNKIYFQKFLCFVVIMNEFLIFIVLTFFKSIFEINTA